MTSIVKNQTYEVTIDGYTSEGMGVARLGGQPLFVRGALRGETCRVKIIGIKKDVRYGLLEEVLTPSPHRIESMCPVYGKCGGCDFLHMDYEEELAMKRQRVADALTRIGGVDPGLVSDMEILGARQTDHYRNKTIYAVGEENGCAVTGFFRRRSHQVIPTDGCLIQQEEADAAAAVLREWIGRYRIPVYNEETGEGLIRHLYVRTSRAGKSLVTIVAAGGGLPHADELIDTMRQALPQMTGLVLNENRTRGNTVLAGSFRCLWGEETLEDELCGLTFRLSVRSFYQVNRDQAEVLYGRALECAELGPDDLALDLYCGTGTISLCLARKAGRVIGAEIVPEAVEDARKNACDNKIDNAEFICADASQAVVELKTRGIRPRAVVVDPPRKGLAEDVIACICEMEPERVVYVSCDPGTLARDVKRFAERGYVFGGATAVDMFPRTRHVETVCWLSRQ